jgi:hypothetical protein
VPARAEFLAAPVECSAVARCLRLETDSLGYLNTPGLRLGTDSAEPYGSERLDNLPGGFQLLAPPQTIFTVDFEDPADIDSLLAGRVCSVSFPVSQSGRLDCLAGWFVLHLGSGQTLSTGPGPEAGCWEQAVFRPPAPGPARSVRPGQAVQAEFIVRKHVALQQLEVTADGDAKEAALPPLALLQTALLRGPGAASLTLAVDPLAPPGQGRQMLDWVTAVAGVNSIPVSAIDCITGLGPAAGAAYTAAVMAPVLPSGRLDQVFSNTKYRILNTEVARQHCYPCPLYEQPWPPAGSCSPTPWRCGRWRWPAPPSPPPPTSPATGPCSASRSRTR